MALTHAILVSLSEQSGSGYELARRFDRSIGHFWRATHQQIYRTLRTMADDGLVQATEVPQQGRPDKKVYAVSEAGRAHLTAWIADPADHDLRDIAVKLRGAQPDTLPPLCAQIVTLRFARAALLDTYRGYQKQQFADPATLTATRSALNSICRLSEVLAKVMVRNSRASPFRSTHMTPLKA